MSGVLLAKSCKGWVYCSCSVGLGGSSRPVSMCPWGWACGFRLAVADNLCKFGNEITFHSPSLACLLYWAGWGQNEFSKKTGVAVLFLRSIQGIITTQCKKESSRRAQCWETISQRGTPEKQFGETIRPIWKAEKQCNRFWKNSRFEMPGRKTIQANNRPMLVARKTIQENNTTKMVARKTIQRDKASELGGRKTIQIRPKTILFRAKTI